MNKTKRKYNKANTATAMLSSKVVVSSKQNKSGSGKASKAGVVIHGGTPKVAKQRTKRIMNEPECKQALMDSVNRQYSNKQFKATHNEFNIPRNADTYQTARLMKQLKKEFHEVYSTAKRLGFNALKGGNFKLKVVAEKARRVFLANCTPNQLDIIKRCDVANNVQFWLELNVYRNRPIVDSATGLALYHLELRNNPSANKFFYVGF